MEQQYKTDAEIYAVLEREIIDLTIRPGSSLSENPLCARFGAPRSLIRVVLQKLQENGLVRIVPYKGTTVTRLNRRIVDELIYERTAVEGRILRDFEKYQRKQLINGLNDLLPSRLIPVVISISGVPAEINISSVTKAMRESLVKTVKCIPLIVDHALPVEEAIITRGGVSVKEIDPSTMESKLVPGLFFAGEIIDVDGYTGGFNLQIAYSTGVLAGRSVR